jgi:hypothetical protein
MRQALIVIGKAGVAAIILLLCAVGLNVLFYQSPTGGYTVGQVVNLQPGFKNERTIIGLKFGDGRLFNFQTCRSEARVEIGKIYDIEWGSHLDEWDCYNVTNIFLIK